MLIREVLNKSVDFLKQKSNQSQSIHSPRLDAEILISWALNVSRVDLYLKFDCPLKEEEIVRCREVIARRGKGEPVAYIKGEKDFYGRSFEVSPAVLVPRPETELLVEDILKWAKALPDQAGLEILDLGSGSGAIGLTLAAELPGAKVTLVDISDAALEVAKRNARRLGVDLRCQFLLNDASKQNYANNFDIVAANPPYIRTNDSQVMPEVRAYEPHLALYAGPHGTEAIMGWLNQAVKFLKPRAVVEFEIGADQGQAAKDIFTSAGVFDSVEVIKDLSELDRFIRAVKNG